MKRAWRFTLWLVAGVTLLRVACKMEDFSFLRFTPVSQAEARELAERGFREGCEYARLPASVFTGPTLQQRQESDEYVYDWVAKTTEAEVKVRVFVSTKGRVQWRVAGSIERLRAGGR